MARASVEDDDRCIDCGHVFVSGDAILHALCCRQVGGKDLGPFCYTCRQQHECDQ